MKTSLSTFLEKKLEEFNISPQKKMDRVWHTAFVRKSVKDYETNKVLEDHPHMDPVKVDELEEGMTRKERRIVAQMRSGYCPLLNNYKARRHLSDRTMQEMSERNGDSSAFPQMPTRRRSGNFMGGSWKDHEWIRRDGPTTTTTTLFLH